MPISKSIISKQAIEDTSTGDHGKRRRRCMQPMLGKMQDNNWAQVYCTSHNGANGRSSRLKQSLNFNRGDREETGYRDKKQQREKSRLWEPTASCGDGRRETRNAEPLQERDNRDNREEAKLNFLAPQPLSPLPLFSYLHSSSRLPLCATSTRRPRNDRRASWRTTHILRSSAAQRRGIWKHRSVL